MELTKAEQAGLVDCLLDMGELLLKCGAEISRVEDTVSRMAKAYGCLRADVFVITSIISLSVKFPNEKVLTETRRISFRHSVCRRQTEDVRFCESPSETRACRRQ